MPNVTVEFSYKRADEDFLLEPTFVNNNTLSLKYKGPDTIKCWVHPAYGEIVYTDVSHPTPEDRARQIKIQGDVIASELKEVTITPETDDLHAMAAWFVMWSHAGGDAKAALMADSEQWNTLEYEDKSITAAGHGVAWKNCTNPNPSEFLNLYFRDDDNDGTWEFDFEYVTKGNDTAAELIAKERKARVEYYFKEFEMTAEADSDAEVYIAKVDKFLTDIDPVRPWYIADQDTGLWAPKMPISVASAVSDAKSSGLSAHRYFDTDTLADHLNTVSYKDLHSC
jgi:hypothetical protein